MKKALELSNFGYSEIALWPVIGLFSGGMLLAAPIVGGFVALLLVGVPTFVLLKILKSRSQKSFDQIYEEIAEYRKNIDHIFQKDPFTLFPSIPKPRIDKDLRGLVKTTTKQPIIY